MTQGDKDSEIMDNKEESNGAPDGSTTPPSGPAPQQSHSAPVASRKQLPSIPDSATQMSLTAKMLGDKKSSRSGHSYGPCFLEYSLMAEYGQVQKQKLPGVYVMPSKESALTWYGILFIRQGMYQEGIFRFSLSIPENYPDGECPRLVFEPAPFHPVIDPVSGELDTKRQFPRWRRNVNHIWQVLLYARRVFYKIDTKSPLNPEAAVLYEQDVDVYKSKISDSIKRCKEKLYEAPTTEDPHAIRFSEWDQSVHEDARRQMLQQAKEASPNDLVKTPQTSGLSWMKKGSNQVFSKDPDSSSL